MTQTTAVLFMQSQEFFGADSQIHASIMTHLDRDLFEVHCAAPRPRDGRTSRAAEAVRRIPAVHVRETEFGPSLEVASRWQLLRDCLRRGVPALLSLIGLARYVRRHRIRIIHCTEKPRDAIYGTVLSILTGAMCVIHVHVKAENWIRPAVRRSMHRAAALIGVSEFVAGSIRDLGYGPSKVFAVLNGLELDNWAGRQPADGVGVREEFGIAPDALLIVSVSRLYRYKGQHELLAALAEVKQAFPDVKVLIVGEDDPRAYHGESSYTEVLKKLCSELDLTDNVIFTGFRTDVRALMSASDIYCMPSFEEPFGMVFLEAMSLGRPVVALDNGGTKEAVDNDGSGLLSAAGDTGALAANLVRLLGDPDLRCRMGDHAAQRVREQFSSQRMTREVEAVYQQLVGRVRPPASAIAGRSGAGRR